MSCGRVGEGLAHRSLGTQKKLTPHPTALENMGWVTQRQVALFTSACSFLFGDKAHSTVTGRQSSIQGRPWVRMLCS